MYRAKFPLVKRPSFGEHHFFVIMESFKDNDFKFIFVFGGFFFFSTPAERIEFSDIDQFSGLCNEKSSDQLVGFIGDLHFSYEFGTDRALEESFEISV